LHQMQPKFAQEPLHLFKPRTTIRSLTGGGGGGGEGEEGGPPRNAGQNPASGAVLRFFVKDAPEKDAKSKLEILDASGKVVREFKSDGESPGDKLNVKAGMNRFVWNLRYADAEGFPGMIMWGSLTGPKAAPGAYSARLKVGSQEATTDFEVKPDPRSPATPSDFEEQLKFLLACRDKLTDAHKGVKSIRNVREQMTELGKRVKDAEVTDAAKAIDKKLTAVEEALHQTKAKSSQDVLNFPIRLNNKLASLAGGAGAGDLRPTDQDEQVRKELIQAIDAELAKLRGVLTQDVPKFNELLSKKKVPGVFIEPKKEKEKKEAPEKDDDN